MGWMSYWEQQQVLSLYGRHARFRCNHCRQPIYIDELHVEDPKKGYFPKEEGTPNFLPRKAKWTIHLHPCNDELLGKHPVYTDERGRNVLIKTKESPNGTPSRRVLHIAERILEAMQKKNKTDWNVARCIATFQQQFKKPQIRQAVRHLKATDQIIKKNGHLHLRKKQKTL